MNNNKILTMSIIICVSSLYRGSYHNKNNNKQFWTNVWENDSYCNKEIPNNQYQGLKGIKEWLNKNGKYHCNHIFKSSARDGKITYCETKDIMSCKEGLKKRNSKKEVLNYFNK